jgi:hypothetical protein
MTSEKTFERLYHDAEHEISVLKDDLAEARNHAKRWEHEAHSLRRELRFLRMNSDTERITREK